MPSVMNDPGQVVHTYVPLFTKQYKLVPANGRWCSIAGKVTVGLASHWPCVTDSAVYVGLYPPTGSMAWEREMSICLRSTGVLRHLYLYLYMSSSLWVTAG